MSDAIPEALHCTRCTHLLPEQEAWPLTCPGCGHVEYGNPLPAAALLVPYGDGLLGVRRNIDPGKGGLAFPGGYVNRREPWRAAGARELHEELGIHVPPHSILQYDAGDATESNIILLFGITPALNGDLPPFVPNAEVRERVILREGDTLVFSTHQAVLDRYFRERRDRASGKPRW